MIIEYETWFNDSVLNSEIINGTKYNIVRKDRSSFNNERNEGGGLCMFIKQNTNYGEITTQHKTRMEFIAVTIEMGASKLRLFAFYIPPYKQGDRLKMIDELKNIIKQYCAAYPKFTPVIFGDFNMANIK